MSDLERNLRQHYEEQKLPDDRVRAILASGRAAADARNRRRLLLVAAAAVVLAGLAWFGGRPGREDLRTPVATLIRPEDVGAEVARFFSPTGYTLSKVSARPPELVAWLQSQGAPAGLTLPRGLEGLPSFGCQVLEVKGQRVYLICFFLDVTPAELAAGGMIKPEMVVTAPDGSMMKKNRPLVHLVVAPAAAFQSPPAPGARLRFAGANAWTYETWSQSGLVYVAATTAPADRLAEAVRTM